MAVARSGTAKVTLPTETQILIERTFAAPPHLVYKACTTPELIKRWWNAKRGEVTVCEVDLRVGGKWRYVMVANEGGFEVAFHGEYKEIVPNERVVTTEVFEGIPVPEGEEENATLNTMTLTAAGGTTELAVLVDCRDRETRDAIISSGMEDGMQDAYDLLEEVAISLS